MKNLVIITIFTALLLSACEMFEKPKPPEPQILHGIVVAQLQDTVNMALAAYCVTDTLQRTINYTENINYALDTPAAYNILDSILKSKPYVDKNYSLITIHTTVETRNLKLANLTHSIVVDWDTTCQYFKLEQKTTPAIPPAFYINVPANKEQQYIDSLEAHPWFFKKADFVYQ